MVKTLVDLNAFQPAVWVPIHLRYQKGRPMSQAHYFSKHTRNAEAKSDYGFKKPKDNPKFNTYGNSSIISTASSKFRPCSNSSFVICHA